MKITRSLMVKGAVLGAFAGVLSGLFGVGGGIIMVPVLVMLGLSQRLASGTSLAATVPIAIVGVITYASHGTIDLVPGLAIGFGSFFGAFLGTWLLQRVKPKVLQLFFALAMVATAVRLFVDLPVEGTGFAPQPLTLALLVCFGLLVGALAGLLGIGGGLIIVPVLVLTLGLDPNLAKSSSLIAMLPSGVSGTYGNLRNHNVSLRLAAAIGLPGSLTTIFGGWLVHVIDTRLAMALFAVLLVLSALQMVRKALKRG